MNDKFSFEDINSMKQEYENSNSKDKNDSITSSIPREIQNYGEVNKLEKLDEDDVASENVNTNSSVRINEENVVRNDKNNGLFFSYNCKECGSSFLMVQDSKRKCPFCGSIYVESSDFGCNSELFIPFLKNKVDAINDYKSKIKNPLIPFKFRDKYIINSMEMIYIPCLLSDVNSSGNITFLAADRNKNGSNIETKRYKLSYTTNFDFKNVCVIESSKIDNSFFEEINNYDFNKLIDIDSNIDLFNNSLILRDDVDIDSINTLINSRVIRYATKTVRETINHSLKKIDNNGLNIETLNKRFVLLPIYYLNVNYNGNNYYYLMNGENGNSIIKKVYSKLLLIITVIIIFVIVFLISYLIAYLF